MSTDASNTSAPVGYKTIHIGLRVRDRDHSLAFYRSLGYDVVGSVPDTPIGHLTMLKLPGDEFVTIELIADSPGGRPPGLNHVVVTVTSIDFAITTLRAAGHALTAEPSADPNAPRTAIVTDPDGMQIELVEWPPGHAPGFTAADWAQPPPPE
jgi:lactoylglutathione lyase